MADIADWSATANSNVVSGGTTGGVGIQGSNNISNFDNAMRDIMARITTWRTTGVATAASAFGDVMLLSTSAGATGATLTGYHNSASPANFDVVLQVLGQGKDSGGNITTWAANYFGPGDVTNGSEDGFWSVGVQVAGTLTTVLTVNNLSISAPLLLLSTLNFTNWSTFTPSFTAFGTTVPATCMHRRVGDSMELLIDFTTGTCTAAEAQMALPGGVAVKANLAGQVVGHGYRNGNDLETTILATGGDTFINFGAVAGSANGLTIGAGNAIAGNAQRISFRASVPIEGW